MQRYASTTAVAHLTQWEALAAMRSGICATTSATDRHPHFSSWETTKAYSSSPFNNRRHLFPSVRSTFAGWEPHSARAEPSFVADHNPESTLWEQHQVVASTSSGLEQTSEAITEESNSTNWELSIAARAFHVAQDPVQAGTFWETAAATARSGSESSAALLAQQKDMIAELKAIANRQHAVIEKLLAKYAAPPSTVEEVQITVNQRTDVATA